MQTAEAIRDANVRYHDLAASNYDSKWGITYGAVGQAQVIGKLRKALGHEPRRYARALDIGAGTGYFSLNLLRARVAGDVVATDISPGMLRSLERSARELGLSERVSTEVTEASALPFEDDSFDLVFGHAVLHHLPDLDRAFREFARVLRPGGVLAFCGEPSRYGDRIASVPKRGALLVSPVWRALMGASPGRANGNGKGKCQEDRLERVVDVHAFTPADLASHASTAGLADIRVTGEELAASLFGWANRTLEATADPDSVPWAWRVYAHRGYLLLQGLDRSLLEPRLPPALFYNLLISARVPA
jgi:SAM-dependent methyltransferase